MKLTYSNCFAPKLRVLKGSASRSKTEPTWHYQWDLIHDPQNILFAWGVDESEGEARVSLEADFSLTNYYGHAKILDYLIGGGKEDLLLAINKLDYYDIYTNGDIQAATTILNDVLGDIIIRDEQESIALLSEFNEVCLTDAIKIKHEEILGLFEASPDEFPEVDVVDLIKTVLGYANAATTSFSEIIPWYQEIWGQYNKIDKQQISTFREELITSINSVSNSSKSLEFTLEGLESALQKMSNQQFKKLYRAKFPDITNAQMQNVMNARKLGTYDYTNLTEMLKASDKASVVNQLDDLTLATLSKSENFKILGTVDFPTALSISGDAINFLQLVLTLQNDLDVSPMDLIGLIPHPISIFAILGDMVVDDMIKKQGEMEWSVAPDWAFVVEWDRFKGQAGLPNEDLYICYTNQTLKCNPAIIPTSIVFENSDDAIQVFGFNPTIADFDIKSKVYQNNIVDFNPTKQVSISW